MARRLLPIVTIIVMSSLLPVGTFADDTVDEASLFQNESSIETVKQSETIAADTLEKTTVSGQLFSRNIVSWTRASSVTDGIITGYSQANIFLDSRLQKGAKLYIDLELSQLSSGTATQSVAATLREIFFDANINRDVYLRVGKQVIQWGRCFFWNPTDLINIERRDFFQLDRFRDGTYGTRIVVPGVNNQNFTLFLGQQNAAKLNQISVAAKHEFLLGNTEIGLSIWAKDTATTTVGFDFSTRQFGVDIAGEIACSNGENTRRIDWDGTTTRVTTVRDRLVNQSAISIRKTWDWDLAERIGLTAEIFYYSAGYDYSAFAISAVRSAIKSNNLYVANQMNQWYGASFLSINEFPVSNTTLTINTIANLVDHSRVSGFGITFSPIVHTTFSAGYYLYWGDPNGEYTTAGTASSLDISATINF